VIVMDSRLGSPVYGMMSRLWMRHGPRSGRCEESGRSLLADRLVASVCGGEASSTSFASSELLEITDPMSPAVYHWIAPPVCGLACLVLSVAQARAQDFDSAAGTEPVATVPAAAPPPPRRPVESAVPASSIAEISVIGRRSRATGPGRVSTSTNLLTSEQIQSQTAPDPLHVLKRVPGVYMEDYNQGTTSTGIGIRGFDTQGDVPAVKLLIDGIPSNFHVGTSELKAIFPLEIDRIELVKGTSDPRYGLNNVAGSVNVFSRKDDEVQVARILAGSFGTIEPQLLSGFRIGRLKQTYFFGYRGSDGFRDNSRMDRFAGSAKVFYEPNERLRLGLIARGMSLAAQSPGYLTPEEARAQPRLSPAYARNDAGEQRTLHLSGHLDYLMAAFSLQAKAYVQSFYRDRNVSFDPDMQQQSRREDELQHGASAVLTYRAGRKVLGLSVELGADYQGQHNLQQRFNTIARVPSGAAVRDYDFTFNAAGSYLQAAIQPVDALNLAAAVRADTLWGQLQNRSTDERHELNDFGVIWQPKASAAWTFLQGQRLYANYGRTFQVNTGIGAYAVAPGVRLNPSFNDGWEAGVRTLLSPWLDARAAVFRQLASGEVRMKPDNSGQSENIGKTLRYGLDFELALTPIEWLSLWGAFSPMIAKQLEPGAGEVAALRRDKWLDHVPRFTAKGGVDYRRHQDLRVSLWFYAQGDYYLTKENDTPAIGDYLLLNLDASHQLTEWLALGLSIQNLLGSRYDSSIWYKDYGQIGSLHSPGSPQSVYVAATVTL
jgi:iron complex outermembrane receptor protein